MTESDRAELERLTRDLGEKSAAALAAAADLSKLVTDADIKDAYAKVKDSIDAHDLWLQTFRRITGQSTRADR